MAAFTSLSKFDLQQERNENRSARHLRVRRLLAFVAMWTSWVPYSGLLVPITSRRKKMDWTNFLDRLLFQIINSCTTLAFALCDRSS